MSHEFDIVIVDDSKVILNKYKEMFSHLPYNVVTFSSSEQGLDWIELNKPTLAFIDYDMPEINGQELIIKFSEKKLFQYTRCFLITAKKIDKPFRQNMMSLGYEKIIPKMVEGEELCNIVEEVFKEEANKFKKSA